MGILRSALAAAALAVATTRTAAQISMLDGRGYYFDWPGCVPSLETAASYCIFPTTMASFMVGQRFDARVEIHTGYDTVGKVPLAPYATAPTATLTVYPNGDTKAAGISIGNATFSVSGSAVTPSSGAYTFTHSSGFNESVGGHALPHTVTKYAYGWTWKGLALPLPGTHTVVLAVNGVKKATIRWRVNPVPSRRLAKNVILFIGDGLNTGIITATRILSRGVRHGATKGPLNMDTMERLGFLSTNGYDSVITDSANSAAAYLTGHKGPVNSLGVYGDTTSSTLDDPKVELITEMAARKYGNANFGLGVVTTAEIQDATPAAFFAHTRRRSDKNEITRQFLEGFDKGAWSDVPEIDVLLGGGGAYFIPRATYNVTDGSGNQVWCTVATVPCPTANRTSTYAAGAVPVTSANNGASLSNRNFYSEAAATGYNVVYDRANMMSAATKNKKLLGIFHANNMDVWLDRHEKTQNVVPDGNPRLFPSYASFSTRPAPLDQPDLSEMTDAAIKVLERRSKDGFFLMVEGASIDKQEHPYDNERAVDELIDMDNAIGIALRYARAKGDTLVLVTSDHGHAFDVFGTVDTAVFDAMDGITANPEEKKRLRSTAVGFYNRAGFPDVVDSDGDGFPDNFDTARYTLAVGYADVMTEKESFRVRTKTREPSLGTASGDYNKAITGPDDGDVHGNNHGAGFVRNLGGTSGVHTMQDVPLYSEGPGADLVRASMANVDLFTLMATALGLGGSSASNPANAPAA